MKTKIAIFISAVLTAFTLVTIGGVITNARSAEQASTTTAPTQEVIVEPTIDPELEKAFADREVAYQELIAQANARLAEAQQTQLALQAQLAALQNPNEQTETTSAISPEDAAAIAAQHMGRADLYSVEATTLYEEMVYKVVFSSGDIVYVGLDGQIIGVAPAQNVTQTNGSDTSGRSRGHGEDDDDHEEHDD